MPAIIKQRYIGDGVYVLFDGYGIWLHANSHDHPTDKIYLEPDVLNSLIKFVDELKEKANGRRG